MLNGIIVEDEKHSAQTLQKMIEEYCEGIKIVKVFLCAEEALEEIPRLDPDILFLDIMLGETDGFSILEKCHKSHTQVIFTTAYDKYAIQAIKCPAVDYLLKPIQINELIEATNKAKKNSMEQRENTVETLLHNFRNRFEKIDRIAYPTFDGHAFADVDDIIRLEANGSYTNMYLKNKEKHVISKPLKEFDQLLFGQNFYRVHYSHLINLSHIIKYVRGNGGVVHMSDGSVVDVAARRKDEFLKALHLV